MSNLKNGHRDQRLKREHRERCRAARLSCHLCHQPIDYTITTQNHPDRFESDHIISVKARPDLAYHPGNLAPSHLRCNRSRGANALPEGQWTPADW